MPTDSLHPRTTASLLVAFMLAITASPAAAVSPPEPFFPYAIEEGKGKISVTVGGKPFATYVTDKTNRPYLFPVYGPTGKLMVRSYPMADVPGERKDHPHHRAIIFGHQGIAGHDTWHEMKTWQTSSKDPKRQKQAADRLKTLGTITHDGITKKHIDAKGATLVVNCSYYNGIDALGTKGKKVLSEVRTMRFHAGKDARGKAVWFLDFDQDLIASEGPVKFDDKKDSGLSIRVPTSMDVDSKKGGTILNANGEKDKNAWSKRATWCSYTGPVGDGDNKETLGVAILNHPGSFRHPTGWHVRTYGLFTANPFASKQFNKKNPDASFELKKGETVKLRHRFVFYQGTAKEAGVAKLYEAYAKDER